MVNNVWIVNRAIDLVYKEGLWTIGTTSAMTTTFTVVGALKTTIGVVPL